MASLAHLLSLWGCIHHPDDLIDYASSTALEVPLQVAVQYSARFFVLHIVGT